LSSKQVLHTHIPAWKGKIIKLIKNEL